MSAIRHLARAAAATGVVLGATFVLAGPAMAADASCQLTRLPGRMSAGGGGAPVVGQVRSSTRETLDVVLISWRIRLSGLDADEVTLGDVSLQEEDGEIRGTEELQSVGPSGSTFSHTLEFVTGAPGGRATLTMRAFIREDDRWKDACSSRVTTTVQRARGTPTPTAPATPLETGLAAASESAPAAAAEPGAAGSDRDSGLFPLYLLGLLLVAGGGGLVAVLLLRRPRDGEPAGYEPAYAAGYGGTTAHGTPAAGYSGTTAHGAGPHGAVPHGAGHYGTGPQGAGHHGAGHYGQPPQPGGPAPVPAAVPPAGHPGPPTRAYPPAVDPFARSGNDAPTAVIPAVSDDRPSPDDWRQRPSPDEWQHRPPT